MSVEPTCHRHPARPARSICAGCGLPICRRCAGERDGQAWCGACAFAPAASASGSTPHPAEPGADEPGAPAAAVPALEPTPPGTSPDGDAPAREPSALPHVLAALAAALAILAVTATLVATRDDAPRLEQTLARATPPPDLRTPPSTVLRGAPLPPSASWGLPGSLLPGTPRFVILPGGGGSGASICLEGEVPDPSFREVAALVDGAVVATAAVAGGRFSITDLEMSPGDHRVSVVAIGPPGIAVESAPQRFHYGSHVTAPGAHDPPSVASIPAGPPGTGPRVRPRATPPAVATLVRPPLDRDDRARGREVEPRTSRGINILRGPSSPLIALTFDGGSDAGSATEVLDALRAKGVHSTLFLTGEFIRLYPDITRRIVGDGHEVGNHTWSHPHLADWVPSRGHVTRPEMTREKLLDELERTEQAFEQTTGARMSRYWRAPFGEINREILGWAAPAWTHVGWTEGLDTLDWVADPRDRRYRSAGQIRDRLLTAARRNETARGGIVLMHLGNERGDDAPSAELPRIIDGLRDEGFRIVTISSLVGG